MSSQRVSSLLYRSSPSLKRLPIAHSSLAFLVLSRRSHATSHTTSSGPGASNASSDFPPPGFDAEKAKKPAPTNSASAGRRQIEEATEAERESLKSKQNLAAGSGTSTSNSVHKHTMEQQFPDAKTTTDNLAQKSQPADSDPAQSASKVTTKKEERKLTIWQKVKKEAAHYWDGTKLLATEVKISSRLALKMAAGYELTRREHRQLHRTTQDLGRLVPFSVFVIVPFAELLLPVALRLFPNLLPSTYEGQKSKDAKAANLRTARKEVSSFLRQTLRESGLPIAPAHFQREEFTEFFRKVRNTGESPTTADVIKVCKIFKDDLTLDNLSRPQLVGICRYMNLNTFGTDALLRYQIRHRMRQIKRDDRAIAYEGVDTLSVLELQAACASRGLRTHGLSPGRLRDDLQMWLDLRLKYGVPSTLLVLSNAFVYTQGKETELSSQIDALQAVLASVPEELFHEIELEVHTAEGAATNRQRLEVLKEQQELIEEENQQSEGKSASPKDDENIDDKDDSRQDHVAKAEAEDKK